jgi:putative aldouronate transport system substrate-binding protein
MAATGITVEFATPVGASSQEAFNVMLASGLFPDIVQANWQGAFPGGALAALHDGIIIELNEPISQWAPNFHNVMQENPDVQLQVVTDEGVFWVFPFLRLDEILRTSTGPMVRADWLRDLNLPTPVTIADWDRTLQAFHDTHGANFSGVAGQGNPNALHANFATAWGLRPAATQGFALRPGTQEVFWAFNEPSFRDYWETMIDWYARGLIDQDIATRTRGELDAGIQQEIHGAFIGPVGGGMGPWITSAHAAGLDHFDIVAPHFPVLNAGDPIYFQGTTHAFDIGSWGHAAITGAARDRGHVEVATRWLDFAYSPEGFILVNWGIEGVSWEWENGIVGGNRVYTDYIHNHPENRSFGQALSYHALSPLNAPIVQDGAYMPQFAPRPQQRNALQVWNFGHNATSTLFPSVSFTEAESDANRQRLPDIQTFFQEQLVRWLHGHDQLTDASWNNYINTLNSLRIDDVLRNHQTASDRFFRRGQ